MRNQFVISTRRVRTRSNFCKLLLLQTESIMGSTTILLSVFAVVLMVAYTEAGGNCPLPSKVYGCSPTCLQDYDCSHGKVCCPNNCNAKSCSEPAANGSQGSNKNQSGTGQYCDNVKCKPFEVCKKDPSTKRNKCSRP